MRASSTDSSEFELIEQAKTNPEAFGDIFNRHYGKILNYLIKRTGNVTLAQDLSSEVFLKAMRALPYFEYRGVPIGAWFYRIANNELRMYYRKHKIVSSLDELYKTNGFEPLDSQDIEQELQDAQRYVERQKQAIVARELIAQLPVRYREVVVLRFGEIKKIGEIDQIIGKQEGTVKSLLSRAMAKLRKELLKHQVQPSVQIGIIDDEGPKKT